jgi:hypothetical protein
MFPATLCPPSLLKLLPPNPPEGANYQDIRLFVFLNINPHQIINPQLREASGSGMGSLGQCAAKRKIKGVSSCGKKQQKGIRGWADKQEGGILKSVGVRPLFPVDGFL